MMMMIMAMVSLADLMPKIYVKYIIEQCYTLSVWHVWLCILCAKDRMMQREIPETTATLFLFSIVANCEEQGKNYALYK